MGCHFPSGSLHTRHKSPGAILHSRQILKTARRLKVVRDFNMLSEKDANGEKNDNLEVIFSSDGNYMGFWSMKTAEETKEKDIDSASSTKNGPEITIEA